MARVGESEKKDGRISYNMKDKFGRPVKCEGVVTTKKGKDGVIETHVDIKKITPIKAPISIRTK